jgi:hypothetical protein
MAAEFRAGRVFFAALRAYVCRLLLLLRRRKRVSAGTAEFRAGRIFHSAFTTVFYSFRHAVLLLISDQYASFSIILYILE